MRTQMNALSPMEYVGFGQLAVAALMLWSLRQTGRNLEYARLQIEGAKLPSLDVSSFADGKVHLLNSGGSEIEQFQIIGFLGAYFQLEPEEVTRVSMSAGLPTTVHGRLLPGEGFSVPFTQLTLVKCDVPPTPGEQEAFAVVFRYYRSADRRPFYKIVSFMRFQNEARSKMEFSYFPFYMAPGSATSGPNSPTFRKVRKALRELCLENFDIGGSADAQ